MTPDEVTEAVTEAAAGLQRALENIWDADPPLEPDDLVALFRDVQHFRKGIAEHEAIIEAAVVSQMDEKYMTLKDGSVVERVSSANKTTWDSRRLVSLLCIKAEQLREVDPDSGEIEHIAQSIERALTECAAFSYFRLGALENYGIDGRDFRQVEWGRKRLKMQKTASSPPPA